MKKYPYGGWWIRKQKRIWSFVCELINEIVFAPWSWIEIFILIILVLAWIHALNKHGGFFKVHRAESISLPIKVHNFTTRESTKLEKFLCLMTTVNIPESPHGILETKKKSPRFGA